MALVCTAVVFVAAIIIGVTCTLRSKEKMKTRKYKEKERIDAGKGFTCWYCGSFKISCFFSKRFESTDFELSV